VESFGREASQSTNLAMLPSTTYVDILYAFLGGRREKSRAITDKQKWKPSVTAAGIPDRARGVLQLHGMADLFALLLSRVRHRSSI